MGDFHWNAHMTTLHTLGFPRMGAQRELKFALEKHWRAEASEAELLAVAATLRTRHWQQQKAAGLDYVTVGDFHHYDQMLTTTCLLGAPPARFGFEGKVSLSQSFQMARGSDTRHAMEMTKWFDTNYHYLVPEFSPNMQFRHNEDWLLPEVREAHALGYRVKAVLVGPLTYLWLGKAKQAGFDRLTLLPLLLNAYWGLLEKLKAAGVEWVQIDEPALALDLPEAWRNAYLPSLRSLSEAGPKLLLATYFGGVAEHADWLARCPIAGLHLDAVRDPDQLAVFAQSWPIDRVLSVGIVNGRNVWRNDLATSLAVLRPHHAARGDRLWLAASCSLLHVPFDAAGETHIHPDIHAQLAFAVQKLEELALLRHGLQAGEAAIWPALQDSAKALALRSQSPLLRNAEVQARLAALGEDDGRRATPYAERAAAQQARLNLPAFPTTTIGSFPQTGSIRSARREHKAGRLDAEGYAAAMREEIALAVQEQEALGLDVLVHGEAERNDMVEYFGEQLSGYAFTQNGWVQSYGSRCVKPPLLCGDIARPAAMTVDWTRYAATLSSKPMKGMLTGPVTMLQWSFVREDQPRRTTALQLALALRDEVIDLEAAGIAIIQMDEPAFREGLPLRQKDWADYLHWAGRAFRIAAGAVREDTQIHTHMCYCEFEDIMDHIAGLDADVISIETSRSDMQLLRSFGDFAYPNGIGPGVYDIHSPRVPPVGEMSRLLQKAREVIPDERLWVNPDCGLKTRNWPETRAALRNMVAAAQALRAA
jgi:5-methyltetrahydropteroyltriglutamate--homocysteine methyltransferase